ncbi:MAG: ABC transporter permease [Chthonomonadaceae bacterium]|nr:ABC transporter permease [Chthonomonadaceae bacterium]
MSHWSLVFKKEIREIFRDKRFRTGAFVMPAFFVFIFVMMFGTITSGVSKKKEQTFAIVGSTMDPEIDTLVKSISKSIVFVKSQDEGRKLLRSGKVALVLEFEPRKAGSDKQFQQKATAIFDSAAPMSEISLKVIESAISVINRESIIQRLKSFGVPESQMEPIKFEKIEAEAPKGLGASAFSSLLPYLIVLWTFSGAMVIAADIVAGEKERGTLETLLLSPATRGGVAIGKFLALAVVSLISSSTSLLTLLLVGATGVGNSKALFPEGINLSFQSAIALLVIVVPLALMTAAILLCLSALAKSVREAQSYLNVANLVVILPAVSSTVLGFTGLDKTAGIKFVPILGSSLCLKEALLEKSNWAGIASAAGVSVVLAVIALKIALILFSREKILART